MKSATPKNASLDVFNSIGGIMSFLILLFRNFSQ